jgi:hypothetical protein
MAHHIAIYWMVRFSEGAILGALMSYSFWLLQVESRDFSQSCKTETILQNKMWQQKWWRATLIWVLYMSFDRFLLAVESRDLYQADKSIIRVSSFSIL